MKIYFEDGLLESEIFNSEFSAEEDYIVSASSGVTSNIETLDKIKFMIGIKDSDAKVYTNSIFAFHNMYAWNEALKAPEIFIRAGKDNKWVRIDKLTNRELKQGHNLAKMYVAGEFEKKRKAYADV